MFFHFIHFYVAQVLEKRDKNNEWIEDSNVWGWAQYSTYDGTHFTHTSYNVVNTHLIATARLLEPLIKRIRKFGVLLWRFIRNSCFERCKQWSFDSGQITHCFSLRDEAHTRIGRLLFLNCVSVFRCYDLGKQNAQPSAVCAVVRDSTRIHLHNSTSNNCYDDVVMPHASTRTADNDYFEFKRSHVAKRSKFVN